jgi:hypothetical protein
VLDYATWRRARGWALSLGVAYRANRSITHSWVPSATERLLPFWLTETLSPANVGNSRKCLRRFPE